MIYYTKFYELPLGEPSHGPRTHKENRDRSIEGLVVNSIDERRQMFRKMWANIKDVVRDQRGSTALEFSALLLPFLMMVLTLFETGIFMYRDQIMEGAVQQAARDIRTGAVDFSGADGVAKFIANVCTDAFETSSNCLIGVDVRSIPSFSSFSSIPALTYNPTTGACTNCTFATGTGDTIVVVRAVRSTQFTIPGISSLMGQSQSPFLNYHTAVFRTEPF